jgi:hypothetical protein
LTRQKNTTSSAEKVRIFFHLTLLSFPWANKDSFSEENCCLDREIFFDQFFSLMELRFPNFVAFLLSCPLVVVRMSIPAVSSDGFGPLTGTRHYLTIISKADVLSIKKAFEVGT